jgi:hypothetical protein
MTDLPTSWDVPTTSASSALVRQYEELPASLRATYSFKEFQWMGAERRNRLVQEECSDPLWEEP